MHALREAAQERAAAGQDDAVTGDVGRQLWRGLLERVVHRGHDVGERRVDRAADFFAAQLELAREPGHQVAAADAGKAAYRASQTRNQEIASESTNPLNDSCMSCHRVFRGRTHCVKP